MHRHRFVKIKVVSELLFTEVVWEKVKSLKDVRLLDETRTQNAVPRPHLVDGANVFWQFRGWHEVLVEEAVLLQTNVGALLLRQAHPGGDVGPLGQFILADLTVETADQFHGILQAPRRQVIRVPVVVDVVLVLVGPRDPEHHVPIAVRRPVHALCPETCHGDGHLHALLGQVSRVPGVRLMVPQRQNHGSVAVNLFKGDFPLVVTLLPVHGDHGVQCCAVRESQLRGILDGFPELVVPVSEQLLRHMFWMCGQEKRQAVRLGVPIRRAAVFLPGEPLGSNVQPRIVATVGLVQVKNVEADGLLRLHVAFNSDVPQRPNVRPRRLVTGTFFGVTKLPAVERLVQRLLTTSRWRRVQRTDQAHVFVEHQLRLRRCEGRTQARGLRGVHISPSRPLQVHSLGTCHSEFGFFGGVPEH